MNNLKKFTSSLDRQKVSLYKNFLRRGSKNAGEEEGTAEAQATEAKAAPTNRKPVEKQSSDKGSSVIVESQTIEGEQTSTKISDKKKEKFYFTTGPHLFVSKVLNKKGPLTSKQIYKEYLKDDEAVKDNLIHSLTHLKQKVIKGMMEREKIQTLGYDRQKKLHKGYSLNPEKAFQYIHPEILVRLEPRPLIKRFNKPDVLDAIRKMEKDNPLM